MDKKATESVVICTYGPSGVGKTTDCGYSFPTALFLAAPGAINSIRAVCGYTPANVAVATIQEATQVVEAVGESGQYDTIVIDDFSFMAEQTFSDLEGSKKYAGFKLWSKMRSVALEFRDKSRYSGLTVVLSCWEQPPKRRDNGAFVRGGPQLSGKLPESIPAMCDIVLKATLEPRQKPWPAVYRCTADPSYVMKDRFNIASVCDPVPLNLGELLRASGHHVKRHADISEEQVQTVSASLSGSPEDDTEIINTVYKGLLDSGLKPTVARWTMRDAIDRACIRADIGTHALTYFSASAPNILLG